MGNTMIEKQYTELKEKLETTAQRHQYDFCHPHVLAVSRRLDQIIVRMMEEDSKVRVH